MSEYNDAGLVIHEPQEHITAEEEEGPPDGCPSCRHPEHPMMCQVDADNGGHPGAVCGCDLMTNPNPDKEWGPDSAQQQLERGPR